MAAFNFPSSPSNGDTYTLNSVTYQYDGTKWVRYSAAVGAQGGTGPTGPTGAQGAQGHQGLQGAQAHISASAPSSGVNNGDLWWESDTGDLAIYYNDGNSSQWIEINTGPRGAQGGTGPTGAQGATAAQGAQGATGSTGPTGPTGAQGATGSTGAQGATGSGGSTGAQGAAGAQGATGSTGAQGATGSTGSQGAAGSATLSNNANNRIITGGSGTNLNGESNLTFDGTTLTATGQFNLAGHIFLQPGGTSWSSTSNRPLLGRQADGELRLGAGSDSSSNITFYTSPSAGGTLVERLKITNSGNIETKGLGTFEFNADWSAEGRNVVVFPYDDSSNWFSFVGTGLRFTDGGNFVKPSDNSNSNWGNIAGMVFEGSNNGTNPAIRFVVDQPGENGSNYSLGSGSSGKTAAIDNNTVMCITGDGNLGLGINSPVARLHVHNSGTGSGDHAYAYFTTGDTGSDASSGLTVGVAANQVASVNYREAGALSLGTSSTERLRIHSDGKITIASGTTAQENSTGLLLLDKNLTAESDVSDKNNYHLVIRSQTNSNTSKLGIAFSNTTNDTHVGAAILHHRTSTDSIGDLSFYTSPSSGSLTEKMKIDRHGRITKPLNPAFKSSSSASYGSSGSLTTTVANVGILQAGEVYDRGGNYDTSTYLFTCPVDGIYLVNVHVSLGNIGSSRQIWVMSYTLGGGSPPLSSYVEVIDGNTSNYANYSYCVPWYFTAGTTIGVGKNSGSGNLSGQAMDWGVHLLG